ncbi:Chemotaxis regulator - transmits chemoreceptor signals to flagelllar motor components CheY [Paramagnetospirillum magnetotacticum MS-1]|uniref:Chemotaxis regulator-transmits chemoreceptor signals to flagelllar motor components CheY n=1 Tax=Paramagnetospirillum magnetotacticum MS-1 TaxID=272627 RepID=A0A0C2YU90_PARME|nr:response regulator [Paramagnetospirillum magnetotacticum]KIL98683.1 Chemotaxis regulator - transmits chemoreceptor signals to flagelllar motor components CheY [Paramagnetospirillum magnetotacticum MS-1]
MTTSEDADFTAWMSQKEFMVVEDVSSARMLEASLLRGLGAKKVTPATDGADALAKLDHAEQVPDIIISDWIMPDVDGLALLEAAKAKYPDVKFIMLTGKTDLDDVRVARGKGVDGYIAKPFTKESLVAALKKLVKG